MLGAEMKHELTEMDAKHEPPTCDLEKLKNENYCTHPPK